MTDWQSRIDAARDRRLPGDILVLADEAPDQSRRVEALCTAAALLQQLGNADYARTITDMAAALAPDGPHLRRLKERARVEPAAPEPVTVFSGHMIDDPQVRGPGKSRPARFPAAKAEAASAAIAAALARIGAAGLGICSGACGGDLLFAEACLARGMRVEILLAREERAFLRESVTFADPDHRWEQSFLRVKNHRACRIRVMPDELGPTPERVSVHDRCNRWILYTALSTSLAGLSAIVLWNGEAGDGPGGTQHMVALVHDLTGHPPEIIDPAAL